MELLELLIKNTKRCIGYTPKGILPHTTLTTNFSKDNHSKDGLQPKCRACVSAYNTSKAKKKNNDKRTGPDADPKARATYKRCDIANRIKRKQAKTLKLEPAYQAEVDAMYHHCDFMNNFGEYHVDHIVPISANKKVCGLHTPANLRVITKEENLSRTHTLEEIEEIIKNA